PMSYRERIEGIIRVYTRQPHEFDWYETSLIRGVASQAASAVVNARLYHEAVQAENIRRQLRLAGDVQKRMIPASPPDIKGLDIAAIYVPCFELAGDFYDFIRLPGGKLGVCVADVVGKGVRASLLMASTRSSLRAHASHLQDLSEILAAVNRDLWRESEMGDFVTLLFGSLDVQAKTLDYCNAGHEPALLARDGRVRKLTGGGGGVIGMNEKMQFRQKTLSLKSGDVLIIFTDGLPEAINFRDEAFGRERVRAAVLEACRQRRTAKGIGEFVLWEMRRFAGLQTRCDDLTVVTIRLQ
ncbi:MAG: PP2C family protein-serine/threonine phosphatase, partial [Planctomycetota bacterium]|nr:PP2C family protein-serine/threonine phosphatase [Planctomycetota bacterium]